MSVMEEPVGPTQSPEAEAALPPPESPDAPDAPDAAEPPGPDRAPRLAHRRTRGRRQVIEWVLLLGAALVIALVVKTFLFQAFFIPSESMVPTLKVHDRVLVNKLSYRLHPVHRGDIVVFTKPKR